MSNEKCIAMQKVEMVKGGHGILRVMLAETGQGLQDPHLLEVLGGILDYCTFKTNIAMEFRDFLSDVLTDDFDSEQMGGRFRLWLYERNVPHCELQDSHFACFGYVTLSLQSQAEVRHMVINILERITEQAGRGALQHIGLWH